MYVDVDVDVDEAILPAKPVNKGRQLAAEVVEGRDRPNGPIRQKRRALAGTISSAELVELARARRDPAYWLETRRGCRGYEAISTASRIHNLQL